MKRLIVKYNSIFEKTERMEIEAKIRREWKERKAVFIPDCCDYEIIDDGINEAAIWLDQEIEKRKAVNGNVKQRGTNVPLQQTVPPMPNIASKIDNSDEIKVGDVVKHFNSLGIVVKTNKYHVCVLTVDRNYITVDKMNLDKTGRNFPQIEKILEQIEHEDRQSKD